MPFLAYVAIILVSLGGILFEVNWLTSPKLESKPAVQASTTAAPPKVAEATIAPRSETAPAPRNVAPTVTMVPAASSAPASAAAASEPTPQPQPAEPVRQQAGTAPAISPAPFGVAKADAPANTNAPSETTGTASADFKREFTTDTKAIDEKPASAVSAATVTPAAATPASAVAASSNNKCDIASCSAAYQSFRVSDCTYQPIDGTARKVCERAPDTAQRASVHETAQRASAPPRDPRIEAASRKASKDAELRAVEREVRRIAPSEAALDPGERRLDRHLLDRGFDRGSGGSDVIVIERGDRDW